MPTYEYRCLKCGIQFDVRQSISENSLTSCPDAESPYSPPSCEAPGAGKVSKVFFAPSITFKGSGFYKNDSRSSAVAADKRDSNGKGGKSGSGEGGDSKDKASGAKEKSAAGKDAGGSKGGSKGRDKAAAGKASGSPD